MICDSGEMSRESSDVMRHDEDSEESESFSHIVDSHHSSTPTTVCMENSSNVHVGPRLHYNAPVTINQYVSVIKSGEKDDSTSKLAQEAGVVLKEESLKLTMKQHVSYVRQLCWGGVALLIATVVFLAVVLPFVLRSELRPNFPARQNLPDDSLVNYTTILPPIDKPADTNSTLSNGNVIHSRDSWASYPPTSTRELPHPTPYVVIAHTGDLPCDDPINCSAVLRNMYNEQVDKFEQPDIVYNFMIDFRGNVYEGRGWDATNSLSGYVTQRNIAICFFGNYVVDTMNEKEIQSLKDLLELGVRLGKLAEDYKLLAHNQVFNGLSPGRNILKVIDKWPHRCLEKCEMPFDTTPSPDSTTEAVIMVPSTSLKTLQE